MVRKTAELLKDLSWTLGGTGLVLITLSGKTLRWGIYISVAALIVHLVCAVIAGFEEDEKNAESK